MFRKSGSRFSSELTKIAINFEKSLKNKTAAEIRAAARKVYTTKQFEEFKEKYAKADYLVAYASKVADTIDRNVKGSNVECKKDLFSQIISDPRIGLNKALESFNPDKLICATCGAEVIDETEDTVSNWVNKEGKRIHIEDGGEFISDKLVCRVCKKSSTEILNEGSYHEEASKKVHTRDGGELVCKSFNSWVVDHIQYPTKNIDKDADKRAQFKEYACPQCSSFILEATRSEDEELTCKVCSEESKDDQIFTFKKADAKKNKKSFYNTEMSYLSQPIGGSDDENLTLNNILYDKDDSEELILRSRLRDVISKIKHTISTDWSRCKKCGGKGCDNGSKCTECNGTGVAIQKTGIFKDPREEAKMFDFFVPSEFLYSEMDIQAMSDEEFEIKVKRPNKAIGLMIAEKAGYTFPYAICLDCGVKISLGKNWDTKFEHLKEQGCPQRHVAVEHKPLWDDGGAYDRSRAVAEPSFQYRIGFNGERGLSAGSNNGKAVEFVAIKASKLGVENYDEKRIAGLNLQLRSHKHGFSDVGEDNQNKEVLVTKDEPTYDDLVRAGYLGGKELITQYMHQVANRWMGKLRKDCPRCRAELEELQQLVVKKQGGMDCPECGYSWDLREGDFLKRIKRGRVTKELWQKFLAILHDLLILRKQNNTNVVSVGKAGI